MYIRLLVALAFVAGVILLYLYIGKLIARAAERKGRSYKAWLAIALLFSPVFAAIAVACMSDQSSRAWAIGSYSGTVGTLPASAPPVSPDGRWWWDGAAWRPMPSA